jgi:hypothetical protein
MISNVFLKLTAFVTTCGESSLHFNIKQNTNVGVNWSKVTMEDDTVTEGHDVST